jgi:signal transduction histidine kinase/ligand-binding sensor domain-containing protein
VSTNLTGWKQARTGLVHVLSLLVLYAAATAQANTPVPADEWVLRSWQTKDGLPQNTIYAMVQTRDGYLWIGTGGGLARFDGARFRNFGLEDGLRSVQISCLAEDRAGVLWIGTHGGGLSRWERGRLTTYSRTNGFPASTVEALAAGRDGSLWIGTAQGLVKYQKGAFREIGDAEGLPQKHVRALMEDSRGALWVSVLLENIFVGTNGHFVALGGPSLHPSDGVFELFEDRAGNIWAGGTGTAWEFHEGIWKRYSQTNGLPRGGIESFAQLSTGALWVGIRNAGLFSFNGNGFEKVPTSMSLSGDDIRELLTADDGTVWVGTGVAGLNRLVPRALRTWSAPEGLGHHRITSVAEDPSGRFWASTASGGIYRSENGLFTNIIDPVIQGSPISYTSLVTGDGSVWVSGESFLYRFHESQPTLAYLKPPISGEAVRSMCEDGDAVWLGSYYSTLLKVVGNEVQVVATNGAFGDGITSLAREAADTLWIGTSAGLFRWDHGNVRSWGLGQGLLSDNIQSLLRESNGTLWVGTLGGGLARLKNGRITNLTSRHGLADDVISQILPDDLGHLWLGCNRGIMRLKRGEVDAFMDGKTSFVHATLLGQDEGMLREQCTGGHSPTAIKTKSGKLLFPTMDGIVAIDPQKWIEPPTAVPQASVDEVRVDGESYSPFSKLTLPPGRRRLEISFAAPVLHGSGPAHFRFRLDPLDKAWINPGSRRTAIYPVLPPGDYVFRVTCTDDQGKRSLDEATLAVTVQPHLWQAWWFRVLVTLGLAGAAFGWYRYRTAELHGRHAAQEEFTRQLMLSQERERKRVASELHDGLGQDLLLIKNRVKLLAANPNHPRQVAQELAQISTHATRAIADVRAISHALRPSAIEQVGFTKAVEWMVEQIAEASTTKFHTELENVDGMLAPESAINAYRVVQEGLNNVLKHSGASEVIIGVKREPPGIAISIFDNGKGFDLDTVDGAGARPNFGLTGMRERAKALGGSVELQSVPGKGTRVSLHVPVNNGEN